MLTENNNTSQPEAAKEASAPVVNQPTGSETQQALLAGKYKTTEDLVKGYNESGKYIRDLTTKLKDYETKIPKAPEEYMFDFSAVEELKDFNPAEDLQLKSMLPVFKELNLSQEQVSKLVENFVKTSSEPAITAEDFKKVLGADAEVKIGRLQIFNQNLPKEDQQILESLAGDPHALDFLYRYMLPRGEENSIPVAAGMGGDTSESSKMLYEKAFAYREKLGKDFDIDSKAKQEYTKMMENAARKQILEEAQKK
jgi:hypothetical protein